MLDVLDWANFSHVLWLKYDDSGLTFDTKEPLKEGQGRVPKYICIDLFNQIYMPTLVYNSDREVTTVI